MHAPGVGRAAAVMVAIALTLAAGQAVADDTDLPSRSDVKEARDAARDQARDVAAVQADLVLANQRLQESAVRAAQAAEAWNGARYRLQQARAAAEVAERRSSIAEADVERQQDAYSDALVTTYQLAPGLTSIGAIVQSDGIETVIDRTTTMRTAEDALDGNYDEFRAASTLADIATQQAQDAKAEALALQVEAREARDRARAAADAAAASAEAIASEKDALIAELARLEDISVGLAERRQTALEERAAEAAAAAAAAEQEAAQDQAPEEQAGQQGGQESPSQPEDDPDDQPDPPATPDPPSTPSPPPPSGGAQAAIGFARAQLGEPYRWGAAGPGAWDCSGLTMGAWRSGGKYLPHYSVAQYAQSTPISAGSLRPGDLVFWGSSSSPSSIYHVALYVGGGQIIHAPRTGRPVTQESMYYWIPPNFHARP